MIFYIYLNICSKIRRYTTNSKVYNFTTGALMNKIHNELGKNHNSHMKIGCTHSSKVPKGIHEHALVIHVNHPS